MPARVFACLLLWLAIANDPAHSAQTAFKPVTIQDLTLLLHGGYTGDEVLRETAGRPLLEPLDAAAENTLRAAGADSRLLAALKATRPALTGVEADAARQQQADLAARTAEGKADYVSRMYEANKQALETQLAVRKQASLGRLADDLRGQLVIWRDGRLQPVADGRRQRQETFRLLLRVRAFAPVPPIHADVAQILPRLRAEAPGVRGCAHRHGQNPRRPGKRSAPGRDAVARARVRPPCSANRTHEVCRRRTAATRAHRRPGPRGGRQLRGRQIRRPGNTCWMRW